jgi:predicted phage tail protein
MTERQFSDDEVAEIFRRASETSQTAADALSPSSGLTLGELQDIGRQVGLAPEAVADAARSLERQEPRFRARMLGLTVGVGRTVPLGRKLTDNEWEQLVVLLRDTFDARGRHRVDGSLREWTNGNLQILIEPTVEGDRLRMRTVNAAARALLSGGVLLIGASAVVGAVALVTDPVHGMERLTPLLPLAGGGVTSLLLGMRRVYGWARTRLAQMDEIARRLTSGH